MQILQTTTGVKILQAIILAGFLKLDIVSKTVHQAGVRHRLQQKLSKARTGQLAPTNEGAIILSNKLLLSDLIGDNDASPTLAMMSSEPTIPKPKRKQIRPTASAIQQRHIDDLKAKRHKLDMHKAALHLYNAKR
jgi:hypothetical protein